MTRSSMQYVGRLIYTAEEFIVVRTVFCRISWPYF